MRAWTDTRRRRHGAAGIFCFTRTGCRASSMWAKWLRPSHASKLRRNSALPSSSIAPAAIAALYDRSPIRIRVMVCRSVATYKSGSKSWVQGTYVDVRPIADHPPTALILRHVGIVELNGDASWRKVLGPDCKTQCPHKPSDIEIVGAKIGAIPPLAPLAERLDDRADFVAGRG